MACIAALAAIIGGVFMHIGATIAGVAGATFGRSVLAAVAAACITWLCSLVFSVIPVIGTAAGFLIGLLLALLAIKGAYHTTLGKALLVWILHLIAQVVAVVVGLLTFASALLAMFE